MAKFTLKADTKDAQKKLKDLRKEIDRLDKDAAKKREIQMKGTLKKSGIATGGMSMVGTAAVSMGSFVGNLGANLVTSALSKLATALSAIIPLILRFGFGFKNLVGMANKWSKALEVAGNAPEHALKAADTLDALDDERRAQRTATLGETYAWDRAFKDIIGDAFKSQMLQRVENLVQGARGGDESSIQTLAALDKFDGNKWILGSQMESMSSPELLYNIIKIFNERKTAGDFTSSKEMEKLFGVRNMGAIAKAGDTSALAARVQEYIKSWDKVFSGMSDSEIKKLSPQQIAALARENEAGILTEADKSERIRGIGDIYSYFVPNKGRGNIAIGAQNIADANRMASNVLSDDPEEVMKKAWEELKNDGRTLSEQYSQSPFGKWIDHNLVKPIAGFAKEVSDSVNKFVIAAGHEFENIKETLADIKNPGRMLNRVAENVNQIEGKGMFVRSIDAPFPVETEPAIMNLDPVAPSSRQIKAFGASAFTALGMNKTEAAEAVRIRQEYENEQKKREIKENTDAIRKMTDAVERNIRDGIKVQISTSATPPAPQILPTFQ